LRFWFEKVRKKGGGVKVGWVGWCWGGGGGGGGFG